MISRNARFACAPMQHVYTCKVVSFPHAGAASAASAAGVAMLNMLVYGGALLYVFSKSAKFSLFKPAEEMVYISLDEEGEEGNTQVCVWLYIYAHAIMVLLRVQRSESPAL